MYLKNQKGIINMAIIALVVGLVLLSVGISMSKPKNPPSAFVRQEEINIPVTTGSEATITPKEVVPTKSLIKRPVSNAEIDKQLQQLTLDEKNMTNAIDDKQIDVMAQ